MRLLVLALVALIIAGGLWYGRTTLAQAERWFEAAGFGVADQGGASGDSARGCRQAAIDSLAHHMNAQQGNRGNRGVFSLRSGVDAQVLRWTKGRALCAAYDAFSRTHRQRIRETIGDES